MTRMVTRVGGWQVVSVREGESAWLTFIYDDVPESLSPVYATRDRSEALTRLVADVVHWQADFMWHYPAHILSHPPEDEQDCVDCAYGVLVAAAQNREDTEERRDPLPPVFEHTPDVAVWHKGRRVRSMSNYFSAKNPATQEVERFCHVEAFSVTGEILCSTARLDEVTFSSYRPISTSD